MNKVSLCHALYIDLEEELRVPLYTQQEKEIDWGELGRSPQNRLLSTLFDALYNNTAYNLYLVLGKTFNRKLDG